MIEIQKKGPSCPPYKRNYNRVPWERLYHAYGPAQDTPAWLLALLSDQTEQWDEALGRLWASICHQGSVYEASCAAVPFLIEILTEIPESRKPAILYLLDSLAHVSEYANRHQRLLSMNHAPHSSHSSHQWYSYEEFLAAGNEYHHPQWMHQAHQLVGEGISTYIALLQSPNQDVVSATLDLLAGFQEQNALLILAIAPLAFEKSAAAVQTAALRCLGALLEQESSYWESYAQLAESSDALPEVTFAAAYSLAWYHPSVISSAIVEKLTASVLPPQSCNGLREVCQALSYLGMPYGFQGFIDMLREGAKHWNILDTLRVAEALLDVAFFGGWVQDRYWHRCTEEKYSYEVNCEEACFVWNYSTGTAINDFAIETFGYDEKETQRLQALCMQKGSHALSHTQWQAIETVLQCEPLWEIKHNLLAIYGLPTAKHELKAFLADK